MVCPPHTPTQIAFHQNVSSIASNLLPKSKIDVSPASPRHHLVLYLPHTERGRGERAPAGVAARWVRDAGGWRIRRHRDGHWFEGGDHVRAAVDAGDEGQAHEGQGRSERMKYGGRSGEKCTLHAFSAFT